LKEIICAYISELAIKAMLYEVSATPKPGLVDRNNAGAHKDMDFFTFMASSASLGHTFFQCAMAGINFDNEDFTLLLDILRPIGVEGEKRMFEATKGVNTHKGLIFSLGIISAAAGTLYRKNGEVKINSENTCQRVMEISKGVSIRELNTQNVKEKYTYGEKLYKRYGTKGIRGEVESGFFTARKYGLPILEKLDAEQKGSLNDRLIQVLLHLMTVTEDSNVLGRHDIDTLHYVQQTAREVLALGGIFTVEGRKKLYELDDVFIHRNISPGGCADLLAVVIMLYSLEKPKKF
jgi:triphosphoribosyl-dephospho-CoA synthase